MLVLQEEATPISIKIFSSEEEGGALVEELNTKTAPKRESFIDRPLPGGQYRVEIEALAAVTPGSGFDLQFHSESERFDFRRTGESAQNLNRSLVTFPPSFLLLITKEDCSDVLRGEKKKDGRCTDMV